MFRTVKAWDANLVLDLPFALEVVVEVRYGPGRQGTLIHENCLVLRTAYSRCHGECSTQEYRSPSLGRKSGHAGKVMYSLSLVKANIFTDFTFILLVVLFIVHVIVSVCCQHHPSLHICLYHELLSRDRDVQKLRTSVVYYMHDQAKQEL